MPDLTLGCEFCFRTIQSHTAMILACSQCGAKYHAACWEQCQACLGCGCRDATKVRLISIPSLKPISRKGTAPVRPSRVVSLETSSIVSVAKGIAVDAGNRLLSCGATLTIAAVLLSCLICLIVTAFALVPLIKPEIGLSGN